MGVGWGTPRMPTRTHTKTYNEIRFADPYKKCLQCGNWIDGVLDAPGANIVTPCEHRSEYRDVCPGWSPVDGCTCANYPGGGHEMRPPADDGKVY